MKSVDEIKFELAKVMGIDVSDIDDKATVGEFFDEEELDDLVCDIEDRFDITVESLDLDDKIYDMIQALATHFGLS